jgi:DNA-binding response OmpR family regulator
MAKVLIVDDEPSIVLSLEFLMRKGGHEVRSAPDGARALALAESFRPDLVLLDVMMPGMDGYEVCRRLRAGAAGGRMRIVMLTAIGGEGATQQGGLAGADLYVTKPFSTRELLADIVRLIPEPQA